MNESKVSIWFEN